jgi:hypothetical protein
MVAVAKNFKEPTKLVFSRVLDSSKPGDGEFSILGLAYMYRHPGAFCRYVAKG